MLTGGVGGRICSNIRFCSTVPCWPALQLLEAAKKGMKIHASTLSSEI